MVKSKLQHPAHYYNTSNIYDALLYARDWEVVPHPSDCKGIITTNLFWDGLDPVMLSRVPSVQADVYVDNLMHFTGPNDTYHYGPGPEYLIIPEGRVTKVIDANITALLDPGINTIIIQICDDGSGGWYGAYSDIYAIRG